MMFFLGALTGATIGIAIYAAVVVGGQSDDDAHWMRRVDDLQRQLEQERQSRP